MLDKNEILINEISFKNRKSETIEKKLMYVGTFFGGTQVHLRIFIIQPKNHEI